MLYWMMTELLALEWDVLMVEAIMDQEVQI